MAKTAVKNRKNLKKSKILEAKEGTIAFIIGKVVIYAVVGLFISIVLFIGMLQLSILRVATNFPPEQQTGIAEANQWNIIIYYGLFAAAFAVFAYWKKRLRLLSGIFCIYWVLGISSLFLLLGQTQSTLNYPELSPELSNENVVSDRSTCNEENSLGDAKQCTALVYRDDGGFGSGFSTQKGYLITNKHVIEGANEIKVWLNGEWRPVKIWNYSPTLDIALLKLPSDIPTCKWFDSSNLNLAEALYAVGWPNQPSGESTITKGVFSRLNKYESGLEFIQTDAAINPGNSGGPLINACGIVGINTEKEFWSNEQLSRPLEGLGNALSSHTVIPLTEKLIAEGKEDTTIPKIYKTPQFAGTPNNAPVINIDKVRNYLARLRQVKQSWESGYGKYPKEVLDFLMDSFTRQIAFCETLIQRLQVEKSPSQDDLFMWDSIVKMSYETAELTKILNSY